MLGEQTPLEKIAEARLRSCNASPRGPDVSVPRLEGGPLSRVGRQVDAGLSL
jgi:hypothetical protein